MGGHGDAEITFLHGESTLEEGVPLAGEGGSKSPRTRVTSITCGCHAKFDLPRASHGPHTQTDVVFILKFETAHRIPLTHRTLDTTLLPSTNSTVWRSGPAGECSIFFVPAGEHSGCGRTSCLRANIACGRTSPAGEHRRAFAAAPSITIIAAGGG